MGLRTDTWRVKGVATPDPAEWPHSTDVNNCVVQCTHAHCHTHAFLHYIRCSLIVMCVDYQFGVVVVFVYFTRYCRVKPVVFTRGTFKVQWIIVFAKCVGDMNFVGKRARLFRLNVRSRYNRVVLNWVREDTRKERISHFSLPSCGLILENHSKFDKWTTT